MLRFLRPLVPTASAVGFVFVVHLQLLAASTPQQPQSTPMFRAGTRLVTVYTTVTDASDRLVPDLQKEDFEVLDDGHPQPLTAFDNSAQPITVIVMLDTSGSMTDSLDLVRDGAEQFLMRLLPGDKGRVGAFNDKIQFSDRFTGDRDELIRDLKDLDFGYPTRLNDAVAACLDELKGIEGRRVILLLTDGQDEGSHAGEGEVLERARNEGVMIYGLGLQTEYFNGQRTVVTTPDKNLKRWVEETGGGYFKLSGPAMLGPTFTRIAAELHTQYLLGFTPAAADGKLHQVTVNVRRPNMKARARKSYFASGERAALR